MSEKSFDVSLAMNRDAVLARVRAEARLWDIAVIGGGATGLGIALDAALRGYQVVLFEKGDFAGETSSVSTKLAHGGVRYLQQGNLGLVREALSERGWMLRAAPHLVTPLPFVVPAYRTIDKAFFGAGLAAYDVMAGSLGIGRTRVLGPEPVREMFPMLCHDGLRGGVRYFDAQFDDARLAMTVARSAAMAGAALLNYCPVVRLDMHDRRGSTLQVHDLESGMEHVVRARAVISAAGPFTDSVRRMIEPDAPIRVRRSRGSHIVLASKWSSPDTALVVPKTPDGRVIFLVPWQGMLIAGTTDIEVTETSGGEQPTPEEVGYLLELAGRYLDPAPTEADVLSVYSGLRPLVLSRGNGATSKLARDHVVWRDPSGLFVIAGGKWTTFRRMAEDAVNLMQAAAHLGSRACKTSQTSLVGAGSAHTRHPLYHRYGTEAHDVEAVGPSTPLHPGLPYTEAEVIWAVRHEMARTVDDVLDRRTRARLLNPGAAAASEASVAEILRREAAVGGKGPRPGEKD